MVKCDKPEKSRKQFAYIIAKIVFMFEMKLGKILNVNTRFLYSQDNRF